MDSKSTQASPMTVVIGDLPHNGKSGIRMLEVWDNQAVDMDNPEAMIRLAQVFDQPTDAADPSPGIPGVALRYLVKRGDKWQQMAMTIPYYKKNNWFGGGMEGPLNSKDVLNLAEGFVEYIGGRVDETAAYQADEFRIEAMLVKGHALPAFSPVEGTTSNTLELVKRIGRQATFMEVGDPTAFRGMVGFTGMASLERLDVPGKATAPHLARLTGLEVVEHGQAVGGYIKGAEGEDIKIPHTLQHHPHAQDRLEQQLYERATVTQDFSSVSGLDTEVEAVLDRLKKMVEGLGKKSAPPFSNLARRRGARGQKSDPAASTDTRKPGPKGS